MKRFLPIIALACVISLCASPLWAAATTPAKGKDGEVPSAGLELAKTAAQITGIAISPLLGVSAVGAYQWMQASTPEQKARLPWFANPLVWLCGFLLVGAAAAKDAFGAAMPPGWKKPLDVLDTVENKFSGLVATGAVVPVLVAAAAKFMTAPGGTAALDLSLGGLAMIHFGAMDLSWLLTAAMVPLAVAVHATVWLASHAINVLILLSPWGAVDAVLKSARTALLGSVTGLAFIDPVVGVTLSVIILIFSALIAGWAFRLTTFGSIFCWDFFTRRRKRFELLANNNRVFLGRKLDGAPVRTYGKLNKADDGQLTFCFKPWLVLPQKSVVVPREEIVVGRGVFYSEVLGLDPATGKPDSLLLLPPRYLGHEEEFSRLYAMNGTCEIGLRKAWSWLRAALGFGKKEPVAATA
ncbi:MAG: hypothetical protein Q8M02_05455 [Candidatus Didemnitutus sp.]|nr:hypothetical protein [Candidatus Didemnitutus sp.]